MIDGSGEQFGELPLPGEPQFLLSILKLYLGGPLIFFLRLSRELELLLGVRELLLSGLLVLRLGTLSDTLTSPRIVDSDSSGYPRHDEA
jgi:hypothetical protein